MTECDASVPESDPELSRRRGWRRRSRSCRSRTDIIIRRTLFRFKTTGRLLYNHPVKLCLPPLHRGELGLSGSKISVRFQRTFDRSPNIYGGTSGITFDNWRNDAEVVHYVVIDCIVCFIMLLQKHRERIIMTRSRRFISIP